jgi:hypothetical protein
VRREPTRKPFVRRAIAVLAALIALAGCTSSKHAKPSSSPVSSSSASTSASAQPSLPVSAWSVSAAGWQAVPLPAPGARVVVIARDGATTYLFGSVPGRTGRAPAAWTTTDARHWNRVALHVSTFYGAQAEFALVGLAGGRISVYGLAYGGAHGLPRPTNWTGAAAGAHTRLVDHEPSVEVFGGEHAIAVNGETARPGTDLIVGQWDGPGGRYGAAVWTSPDGVHWTRNASDPALVSAPGEQTAARGTTAAGDGFVVVGDTLRGGGTTALSWTSPDGRVWRRTPLPYKGSASAARVGCDGRGCVVVGATIGAQPSLACWTLRAGAAPSAGPPGPNGGLVEPDQVLMRGGEAMAVVAVDSVARLVAVHRDCTGWTPIATPTAAPDAAVGEVGAHLLLATTGKDASQLWLR